MTSRREEACGGEDLSIVVHNLAKEFRHKGSGRRVVALERLDFSIPQGQRVCMVGPTGCGKSTFFSILCGLERPTRGEVRIGGREPYRDFHWFKGKIGIIFQQDRLLPWRSALDNVALGLELLDLGRPERERRARQWLQRLGLGDFLQAYPAELSGGMRQRVAMARAFALEPRILLADEAFGHLDEVTARQLRGDFLELARQQSTTVILITHQLEEAMEAGDRILVLGKPARLVADLDPETLQTELGKEGLKTRLQELLNLSHSSSCGSEHKERSPRGSRDS